MCTFITSLPLLFTLLAVGAPPLPAVEAFAPPPPISFVLIREVNAWEPGIARISRQLLLFADGSGQEAMMKDGRLLRLASFSAPGLFESLDLKTLAGLKGSYAEAGEQDPSVIVEGNPLITQVVFLSGGGLRFIECIGHSAPGPVILLKNRLRQAAGGQAGASGSGRFIAVFPLPAPGPDEEGPDCSPEKWDAKTRAALPALFSALERPGFLAPLADGENKAIRGLPCAVRAGGPGFTLAAPWGEGLLESYRLEP